MHVPCPNSALLDADEHSDVVSTTYESNFYRIQMESTHQVRKIGTVMTNSATSSLPVDHFLPNDEAAYVRKLRLAASDACT